MAAKLQRELLEKESALQDEIEALKAKMARKPTKKKTKLPAAKVEADSSQLTREEAEEDARFEATMSRLESMMGMIGAAEKALDRRDERRTAGTTAAVQVQHEREEDHAQEELQPASKIVEVMSMLKDAPTEALVDILQQLRRANGVSEGAPPVPQVPVATPSAVAMTRTCGSGTGASMLGSLNLKGGEATALVDIMAMMESAPTEALADILARLRSLSGPGYAASGTGEVPGPDVRLLGGSAAGEAAAPTRAQEQAAVEMSNLSPGMRQIVREITERETALALDDDDDDDDEQQEAATSASRAEEPPDLPPALRLQHSAVMSGGRARLLRAILTGYFAKHAPEGMHKINDLVARVVGGPPSQVDGVGVVGGVLWDEAELFQKLEAKYGKKVDLDPQSLE